MIDRVGNGKRVDVNFGFPERIAHASERAEPIRKKDRELRCRFQGELGIWIHGVSKVMPSAASDNSTKLNT
jgi:hypothetical protein